MVNIIKTEFYINEAVFCNLDWSGDNAYRRAAFPIYGNGL